jgi:hypothetical protein
MVNEKSEVETHYTCTSTPLENTAGSKKERISTKTLDEEVKKRAPLAEDPLARIIQWEQAERRSKIRGS